jgi:hypothetical protein
VQLLTISVSDAAGMKLAIESFAAEPNGGLILGRGLPLELQREFVRLAEQISSAFDLWAALRSRTDEL